MQSLNNLDQRHIPSKVGILESNVSKQAVKFDPISALDDEFYSYTGGKDKEGECHAGSGTWSTMTAASWPGPGTTG